MQNKVIIIAGPTASGKTACSVELCRRIDGEVVSADSMQIYKEMSVGTAVPSLAERMGIPHYMLQVVSPDSRYSVALYQQDAFAAIDSILAKGKTPVVVGGTGLYINSLLYELDFKASPNDKLREELSWRYDEDPRAVYSELVLLDPLSKERIHINNKTRVIRRLEILKSGGGGEYEFRKDNGLYDFVLICLTRQREVLYRCIDNRVEDMLSRGLEKEARSIYAKYGDGIAAFSAIGYKELLPYFNGICSLNDASEQIKKNTRHYAKRQWTWFKREDRFQWYDPDCFASLDKLIEKIMHDNTLIYTGMGEQ